MIGIFERRNKLSICGKRRNEQEMKLVGSVIEIIKIFI